MKPVTVNELKDIMKLTGSIRMKTFRVKEQVECEGWSYIEAENIEEAKKKLSCGEDVEFGEPRESFKMVNTYWETLEEVGLYARR